MKKPINFGQILFYLHCNMTKPIIPYVEFYITNVCNLACAGCNRFNNFNFTGYQKWNDYADQYAQWAEQVDVGSIAILGGEPLLNPTFMQWVGGVKDLWPGRLLRIITNGFQLNKVAGLYDVVNNNKNIQMWVGIHNKQHKKEIFDIVTEFLHGELTTEFNQDNQYQQYAIVTDENNVKVRIEYNWWFHQGPVRTIDGLPKLYNSDPEKAHKICNMKTCHHFIRGKLYKCGIAALVPEFDQQFPIALDDEERKLMHSYQPLTLEHTAEEKEQFIKNLSNPIDQCRFCPEEYNGDQIWALKKKELKL